MNMSNFIKKFSKHKKFFTVIILIILYLIYFLIMYSIAEVLDISQVMIGG